MRRQPRPGVDHLQAACQGRRGGRPATGRRRQRRSDRRAHRRQRRGVHRHRGRSGQQQQRAVAAGHERFRARIVGEGHRRPRVRAEGRRGPGRAVVCPLACRHRAGARDHGPCRPSGAGHRQARKAGRHRQSRGDRAGVRRRDGRARRPRRGASARRSAAGAEARHPNGKGECQTRHRRHPDAGVDDRALPADSCRGVRRRQRGPRRRRRGHALRRDVGGQVSAGGRQDDGPHHLRGRGELGRRTASRACAAHQARCDLLCRPRHR